MANWKIHRKKPTPCDQNYKLKILKQFSINSNFVKTRGGFREGQVGASSLLALSGGELVSPCALATKGGQGGLTLFSYD